MAKVKKQQNAAVQTEEVKKEMGLLDKKIGSVEFTTHVCIEPIYSKKNDRTYLKITLGEAQDKVIFVSQRKDGKGVSCMTDWKEYVYEGTKAPTISKTV